MPAKSKAQWRLMKACEENKKACPGGMTPEKAKEYTRTSPKSLPEKKGTKKKAGK